MRYTFNHSALDLIYVKHNLVDAFVGSQIRYLLYATQNKSISCVE